jgi:hypothetical protein
MSATVKRTFGTNLSNKKRDSSASDAHAAIAAAKLSQKEKLERWKQQRAAHTVSQQPAATPVAVVVASTPVHLDAPPTSALLLQPTPVSSKKALPTNPNATSEIFYTPSSSPTNFKQRVRPPLSSFFFFFFFFFLTVEENSKNPLFFWTDRSVETFN